MGMAKVSLLIGPSNRGRAAPEAVVVVPRAVVGAREDSLLPAGVDEPLAHVRPVGAARRRRTSATWARRSGSPTSGPGRGPGRPGRGPRRAGSDGWRASQRATAPAASSVPGRAETGPSLKAAREALLHADRDLDRGDHVLDRRHVFPDEALDHRLAHVPERRAPHLEGVDPDPRGEAASGVLHLVEPPREAHGEEEAGVLHRLDTALEQHDARRVPEVGLRGLEPQLGRRR
jgi:hypothetical protein